MGQPMKYRLLVIDDEIDEAASLDASPRRANYEKLQEKFDLIYLDDLRNLLTVLKSETYDAVLLDFVLERWSTTASYILKHIDPKYPVALISARWGSHFPDLRNVLDEYKIGQLFAWDELEDPDKLSVVMLWLDVLIHKAKRLSLRTLDPNESVRILQISDPQFGSPLPESFDGQTRVMVQAILSEWRGPPHFIMLTGDITESGLPSQFSLATAWISDFTSQLDETLLPKRFFMVPGNHDICRPLGWSGRVDVEKKELSVGDNQVAAELQQYALAPFHNFAASLGDKSWIDGQQYWTNGEYRRDGIILFGYNTCEALDSWSVPTRKIVDKTFSRMFGEIEAYKKDAPNALILGLMHHPITASDNKDQIVNRDTFLMNLSSSAETLVTLTG